MTTPVQEKRFDYQGIPCVILFMPMGFRCGYIGIPAGVVVNESDFECHGGVTYIKNRLHCQEDTDKLWICFDCGHACDGFDVEKIKEYFPEQYREQILYMGQYWQIVNKDYEARSLEYCENECRKMVDQYLGGRMYASNS